MNLKLLVILLALLGSMYPILLNIFKRKSSTNPIPENVKDVYDDETYTKWRSYNAEHSRLDLLSGIVSLLVTFILLLANVFSAFASLFPATMFWQTIADNLTNQGIEKDYGNSLPKHCGREERGKR